MIDFDENWAPDASDSSTTNPKLYESYNGVLGGDWENEFTNDVDLNSDLVIDVSKGGNKASRLVEMVDPKRVYSSNVSTVTVTD